MNYLATGLSYDAWCNSDSGNIQTPAFSYVLLPLYKKSGRISSITQNKLQYFLI